MDPIEIGKETIRTRPKLIRKMRLAMYAGLVAGPLVFGIGVYDFFEKKSLQTRGVTIEAAVQSTSVLNTGKGRRVYRVVADYRPEGYPIHRKEFVVREDEYEDAEASGKILVTYLPGKPSVSSAGEDVRTDPEPMAIGAGVFVVAVLILLYFRRKEKEIERAIWGGAAPPEGDR